ncbi:PREDICTED: metaxin-1 [Nicrophorus vespilloides]|uniref:Metaxin-1 n=1 Tax=Nicrophorus vespilloides TaxID=110193 RepID=A0ABM1MN59_NICVS|nr:PREDICTED: metaxin-1 [Nicrophorus vespilloides]
MEVIAWNGDYGLVSICPDCIRLITYLKFAKVPAEIHYKRNPYWFSESRFPIFRTGRYALTQYSSIVEQLRFMRYSLDFGLSCKNCSETLALMCQCTKMLEPLLEYTLWLDRSNFEQLTRPWYTKVMPFLLNVLYIKRRQSKARDLLEVHFPNTEDLTTLQGYVRNMAVDAFSMLSTRLGKNDYFYGSSPSSLDCMVYAYLAPLAKIPFPSKEIQDLLKTYPTLLKYVSRIDEAYFSGLRDDHVYLKIEAKDKQQDESSSAPMKTKLLALTFVALALLGYAVSNNLVSIPKIV